MSSLIEVKSKIAATRNTRKITKAMQLVATSRMKQLQKTAVSVRNFAGELINLWTAELHGIEVPRWQAVRETSSGQPAVVSSNTPSRHSRAGGNPSSPSEHRPLNTDNAQKRVFVLYSSDKGLCGGMNQQLIKALINSSVWLNTPEQNRIVVVFGRKGTDYLRFRKIAVDQSFVNLPDTLTPADAYGYIDQILKYWEPSSLTNPLTRLPAEPVSAVYMVAPHYKNSFTFYPIVKQFLPITQEALRQHLGPNLPDSVTTPSRHSREGGNPSSADQLVYFEPDKQTIAESVLENLANALFLQAFYELKATEYSSRMIAMQNATSAAEKMIDEKTLLLNSIRQQRITQEIAEITGSAMVIN
jgi:F-type H+-transporting ATPase subunit gamma